MSRAHFAVIVAAVAGLLPLVAPGPAAQAVLPCLRELSIADYRAAEGTIPIRSATTRFTFTVTSSGCARAGGVLYESGRPAGTGPADIAPVDGSLWFPDGDMSPRIITVEVAADLMAEPEEQFEVRICHGTPGAIHISRAIAHGTIINDDQGTPDGPSGWERGFRCSE